MSAVSEFVIFRSGGLPEDRPYYSLVKELEDEESARETLDRLLELINHDIILSPTVTNP